MSLSAFCVLEIFQVNIITSIFTGIILNYNCIIHYVILIVTKALTLLGECVKRKQSEVVEQYSSITANQAANCDVEILKKWYPHSQLGFDKLNRPILFEHSGGVNSGVLLQLTTLENLIRYHWWTMENELNRMFDAAAARGDVVISTCVILDFSGMTLSHFSSQALDQVA